MPQNHFVYGKRRIDRSLAAQCFSTQINPVKPNSSDHHIIATPIESDGSNFSIHSAVRDGASSMAVQEEIIDSKLARVEDDVFGSCPIAVEKRNIGIQHIRANVPLRELDGNARNLTPRYRQARAKVFDKDRQCLLAETGNHSFSSGSLERQRSDGHVHPASESVAAFPSSADSGRRVVNEAFDEALSTPTRVRRSGRAIAPVISRIAEVSQYARPLLSLSNDQDYEFTPSAFQSWGESIGSLFNVVKIAEASYGEVYRLILRQPQPGFNPGTESVLKIIALKPPVGSDPRCQGSRTKAQQKRTEAMSAIADVASEVRLLQHMSAVPGFVNFRDIKVMQGQLPKQFVSAWRAYNKDIRKSEFPDPGRKTSYEEGQLWAIIEMQDAGKDLETERLETVWECWDAFWSMAMTLAKGEEFAAFEHRDLHLGNVCIKRSHPFHESDIDLERRVGFTGIETMLIDYTISRAEIDAEKLLPTSSAASSASASPNKSQERISSPKIVYFDLTREPSLFCGNAEDEYQYEIYRFMRSAVIHGDPCHDTIPPRGKSFVSASSAQRSVWEQHHPLTNLLWLHYLLYKLCEQLSWPSSNATPGAGTVQDMAIYQKALQLEERLQELVQELDPSKLKEGGGGLQSAKHLVFWAVERDWLHPEDVTESHDETLEIEMSHLTLEDVCKHGSPTMSEPSTPQATRKKSGRRKLTGNH